MPFNITFWLVLALITSVIGNIFLFWYARVLLGKLMYVGENIGDLVEILTNYKKHLKTIYGMEMYYGDETLKFLMSHTNSLLDLLDDYSDVYNIVEFEEEEIPTLTEEEQIENAEETINQENVFYAGTRTSNN